MAGMCHITGSPCNCTAPALCRPKPETYVASTLSNPAWCAWSGNRDFNGFLLSGYGRTPLDAIVDLLDAEDSLKRKPCQSCGDRVRGCPMCW